MRKSFAELLATPVDAIEAPKLPPVGSWRLTIATAIILEPKDKDSLGAVLLGFELGSPLEDVDAAELEEFGDYADSAILWNRFRLRDEKDQYYLDKFITTAGGEREGRSLEEALKGLQGYEVIAQVEHQPNANDPDLPWVRLTDFAAA